MPAQVIIKNSWDIKVKPQDDATAKRTYKQIDLMGNIIMFMTPCKLRQMKNYKTTKEVWDSLKSVHQIQRPATKETILKKKIHLVTSKGSLYIYGFKGVKHLPLSQFMGVHQLDFSKNRSQKINNQIFSCRKFKKSNQNVFSTFYSSTKDS